MDSANETTGPSIDKAGGWRRLKREGRLDEFSARREVLRNDLRKKGMKRKQAAHEAWRIALAEFPPLQTDGLVDDELENAQSCQEVQDSLPPPPPYESSDTIWVYHHIPLISTQQSDAPSPGAWSLLQFCRDNPSQFYAHLLPKSLAAIEKKAQDQEPVTSENKTPCERLEMFRDSMSEYQNKRKTVGLSGMDLLNTASNHHKAWEPEMNLNVAMARLLDRLDKSLKRSRD